MILQTLRAFLDEHHVRYVAASHSPELAGEADFRNRFPHCEVGAMPPFGNLFDMQVYFDEALAKQKKVAFNAGSHSELVQMAVEEFAKLVKPRVARISTDYVS